MIIAYRRIPSALGLRPSVFHGDGDSSPWRVPRAACHSRKLVFAVRP